METIDRFDWMSQYIKRRYQDMDGVTLGTILFFCDLLHENILKENMKI